MGPTVELCDLPVPVPVDGPHDGSSARPEPAATARAAVRRQDGSTRSVLEWVARRLGTGPRDLDRAGLAALLTPLGWEVTVPDGDPPPTAHVHGLEAERMVLLRYEGFPYTAAYHRAATAAPDAVRLAVVELVHEGTGRFVRHGEVSPLGPGDVLLHPPRGRHRVEWTSARCRRTYVLLSTSMFGRRTDEVLRAEDLVLRDAWLAPAAEKLVEVLYAPDLDPLVQVAAAQALQTLLRATVARAIDPHPAPASTDLRAQVRAVLLDRFADPDLSADVVAREMRISRRSLFALYAGTPDSFATSLRDIRLDHAAELLAGVDRGWAVRRVAREAGFAGPAQLSRAFRERFGMTPTQFRAAALRGLPLPDGR